MVGTEIEIPDVVSFKFEPGTTFALKFTGWRTVGKKSAPYAFGRFDSIEEAKQWLEKTGFEKDDLYDSNDPCHARAWVYRAENGSEPLIVEGDIYVYLLVRIIRVPPLPVLFSGSTTAD